MNEREVSETDSARKSADTLVIVDLEATCCNKGGVPRKEMEIIEIGAVEVDAHTGEVGSEFQSFVRPVRHRVLTPFCTRLTSIRQEDVDGADSYVEVVERLRGWLSGMGWYDFCSWGFYDKGQFEQDSAYHSIPYPFKGAHRNLKLEFSAAMGTSKGFGLGIALEMLGLEFEGTPHRGIDDAWNIARVYRELLLRQAAGE